MRSMHEVLQPVLCGKLSRFGRGEKFSNVPKAQCHAVSTAIMKKCGVSVHENVVGYDQAFSCKVVIVL